jgi:hypothetical protein
MKTIIVPRLAGSVETVEVKVISENTHFWLCYNENAEMYSIVLKHDDINCRVAMCLGSKNFMRILSAYLLKHFSDQLNAILFLDLENYLVSDARAILQRAVIAKAKEHYHCNNTKIVSLTSIPAKFL